MSLPQMRTKAVWTAAICGGTARHREWDSWSIFAESAFRTKGLTPYFDFGCDADCDYDEIAEKAEKLIAIMLVNSDHAAADMRVLYDSEENVIKDTDAIYHKQ